jgi:hypothetical protein
MSRPRPRMPSPSLVVSIVALVVALGGTSYAALSLGKNTVGTAQLKNNAVTTSKIRNGAVTGSKITNHSVAALQLNLSGLTAPNASHANFADSARAVAYAHVLANGFLDTADSKNVSAASHLGSAGSGLYCLKVDVPVTNLTATVDAVNSGDAFGFASGALSGEDSGFVSSNCPSGDNAVVGTADHTGANADMAFWVTFN